MSDSIIKTLKTLRQSRQFTGAPISADDLATILEVARWSGSSRNTQPWQLVVVQEKAELKALADIRPMNSWMADASAAIAIALPTDNSPAYPYDEGRLSERIMLAAKELGFGSGTAWFTSDDEKAAAKSLLGLPDDLMVHSMVIIGAANDAAGTSGHGGRKPLDEIVSYGRYGQREK